MQTLPVVSAAHYLVHASVVIRVFISRILNLTGPGLPPSDDYNVSTHWHKSHLPYNVLPLLYQLTATSYIDTMSLTSLTFPFLLVRSKISPQSPASAFLSPRISAPPLAGVHHLSFPVSNLDVSLQWYISVLSASHLLVLDRYSPSGKRYAAVLALSALGHAKLELE